MKASYYKHILEFKAPSGTSRGVLSTKETWFLVIEREGKKGIGECAILRGLSMDDVPDYEEKLRWTCQNIHLGKEVLWDALKTYPSIQFGVETAFLSLEASDPFLLYPSDFTLGKAGIAINGLIWMGSRKFMQSQIAAKIKEGYDCIKMKIGAIDFDTEFALLQEIRDQFNTSQITLRVDANGAFAPDEALQKLTKLSKLSLHSIEQPIATHQTSAMQQLCVKTPLPIALDEELIGITKYEEKETLLKQIQPQYIILKPSLIGGFRGTQEWIDLAERLHIGWWITSALESNIGLNAIAQFTYTLQTKMPQGLGTGSLFTNNLPSPLFIENGFLKFDPHNEWQVPYI